jgi:hypothetical protein
MCAVEGCDRVVKARGWCRGHWQRWRRTGSTGGPFRDRSEDPVECVIDGCSAAVRVIVRGWCNAHYVRWQRFGDPLGGPGSSPAGTEHYRWTETPSYGGVHMRLKATRGSASQYTCRCGEPAQDWAYDHLDPEALTDSVGRRYSTDMDRYRPLCKKCHRREDYDRVLTRRSAKHG